MTPAPRMRDLARKPGNWLEALALIGAWAAIIVAVQIAAALLS